MKRMHYRTDEKTGNQLSALGYGCMRLPRGVAGIDMKKAEQLILRAVEAGVNYFDTAYIYPGSEAALGKVLSDNGLRERVYVATKLPFVSCKKPEDIGEIFEKQLASLRTDYIDYYLMHNINSLAQWEALCQLGMEDWIAKEKNRGRIRRIGFSFHGSKDEFIKTIDAYDWDCCLIQYNYSDENYQAGVTGLRRAAEKGMPVIVMEPLLGGKLANGLPPKAEKVFRAANPNLSNAAWGLRWLLNQPEVTVILSGMGREDQLADNLSTVDSAFPGMLTEPEKEAYRQVVDIFRESYKVPCTGCGYCLPCPANVNIPGCFAAYNTSFSMGMIAGLTQYVTSTGANRRKHQMAGNCVDCGKCESHCPQHIPIREALKTARKRMEPFYFRAALSVVRRVIK